MSKSSILSVLAVQLLISGMACAQPAAGDTYTYRVINVYNNETRGQVTYRIDSINADRVTVAVTPSAPIWVWRIPTFIPRMETGCATPS